MQLLDEKINHIYEVGKEEGRKKNTLRKNCINNIHYSFINSSSFLPPKKITIINNHNYYICFFPTSTSMLLLSLFLVSDDENTVYEKPYLSTHTKINK